MRVEHHLLRLARIGAHEQHAAVAQADMRDLHRHRDAVQHDDLMAPVELVGFARREAQRHEGGRRHWLACSRLQRLRVAPHGVIAALVAEIAQLLENPDQRQPLARRLVRVPRQQPIEIAASSARASAAAARSRS